MKPLVSGFDVHKGVYAYTCPLMSISHNSLMSTRDTWSEST